MARKIPGTTTTSNGYHFSGDDIQTLPVSTQVVRWNELTPAHVDDLAAQIAAEGQLQPVWIRRQANGNPELVEGRHRQAAVLKINANLGDYGLKDPLKLWAVFHDLDDEQTLLASFRGNDGLKMSDVDLSNAVNYMTEVLDWDGKRVSKELTTCHRKVLPSMVSKLKKVHRMPREMKVAIHTGSLPLATAFLILETGGSNDELLEEFRQLATGEMTKAQLRDKVTGKQREAGKTVKRTLPELVGMLGAVSGNRSATMLAWLGGDEGVAGDVLEIFRELPQEDHTAYMGESAVDHNVDSGRSPGANEGDEDVL